MKKSEELETVKSSSLFVSHPLASFSWAAPERESFPVHLQGVDWGEESTY